jgi:hypothetical protein
MQGSAAVTPHGRILVRQPNSGLLTANNVFNGIRVVSKGIFLSDTSSGAFEAYKTRSNSWDGNPNVWQRTVGILVVFINTSNECPSKSEAESLEKRIFTSKEIMWTPFTCIKSHLYEDTVKCFDQSGGGGGDRNLLKTMGMLAYSFLYGTSQLDIEMKSSNLSDLYKTSEEKATMQFLASPEVQSDVAELGAALYKLATSTNMSFQLNCACRCAVQPSTSCACLVWPLLPTMAETPTWRRRC